MPAETIARVGREFAATQPSLLRLGVGAQRHMGAPVAYRTIACLPALAGSWRHDGGGCSYIPTATAGAIDSSQALRGPTCAPGPVRRINMSQLGRALTDPALDPAGHRARLLGLQPGGDRARPDARARGAAPRGPVHRRARAVPDRHRAPRRRRAARHHPARAPRRRLLLGPSLRHLQRARDRAARAGEAEHGDLPAAGRPPGARRPVLPARPTRRCWRRCSRTRRPASRSTRCASAAG